MSEVERLVYELLTSGEYTAEDVIDWLTDYHGTQLLGDGFAQHLVDEGVCEPSIVGLEEDEDE